MRNAEFLTMSPYYYNGGGFITTVTATGALNDVSVTAVTPYVRLVIELKSTIIAVGFGTSDDPWVVQ